MGIETPVGGQWEVIRHATGDSLTGGYTGLWRANGDKYLRLRFFLGFAGLSLHLRAQSDVMLSGAISYQQGNGSGNYQHPHRVTNSQYGIAQRGTGYVMGTCIPRRDGSESGWLMGFRGFSALSNNWNDVGNAQGTFSGRIYWWRNPPSLNDWSFEIGFDSLANEAGAYQLLVEGERAL